MIYTIKPGESLSDIAQRQYGAAGRWREIAAANKLRDPNLIFAGETLTLSDGGLTASAEAAAGSQPATLNPQRPSQKAGTGRSLIPANYYLFVLADEIDPTARKIVRRVLVNPKMAAELSRQLGKPIHAFPNPERYGFFPSDPSAKLAIGRHAQGMKPSPHMSASDKMFGARRFSGKPFWIDVRKAKAAGATIHETSEIVADLDRILAKTAKTPAAKRLQEIRRLVASDGEVLATAPRIPASAVKGAGAMAMTRGLHGVQVIGFALTAYDLTNASEKSLQQHSVRPISAEAVRQAGSWTAAWAGMRLGAAAGGLIGIETGPGAIATAAIGGIIGGTAGYFGFDWIADHIDEN